MNSHDPHFADDLDGLLRRTLSARVEGQEPPKYVWDQIMVKLRADELPPRRFPTRAIQSALALLFTVILVGVGLQDRLAPGDAIFVQSYDLPLSVTTVYEDEHSDSSGVAVTRLEDESELRLLKSRSVRQHASGPNSHPPVMVPLDVPPHSLSPEGRLLQAELSLRRLWAEERYLLHSGPYQW